MNGTAEGWTRMELLAALRAAGWKRLAGPAAVYESPEGVRFHLDEFRAQMGVLWRWYAARRRLPPGKKVRKGSARRMRSHAEVEAGIVAFVDRFWEEHGDGPLLAEIAAGVDCNPSTVSRRLAALERAGRITRRKDGGRLVVDVAGATRGERRPRAGKQRHRLWDGARRSSEVVFDYLVAFKAAHAGDSPSAAEIAEGVGLAAKSAVLYHLELLEEAGRIERDSRRKRICVRGGSWSMGVVSSSEELARSRLHPTAQSMYRFILRFKEMHAGDSPTRREIQAGVGLPSVSMVQHHLEALEEAGLIERPKRGQARRIGIPGAIWRYEPGVTPRTQATLVPFALEERLPEVGKRAAAGGNKCASAGAGDGGDWPEEEKKMG